MLRCCQTLKRGWRMSNLQDDVLLAGLRWLQIRQDFVVVVCNEVNGLRFAGLAASASRPCRAVGLLRKEASPRNREVHGIPSLMMGLFKRAQGSQDSRWRGLCVRLLANVNTKNI